MPNMKYKSEENFNAANLLIINNMYAASIHCSYYSCFQLSKYLLKTLHDIDYAVQESNSSGKDSHYYVNNETSNKIDSVSHIAYIDYNKFIAMLKKLRRRADYSAGVISEEEAKKAYQCANEIKTILNNKFTT